MSGPDQEARLLDSQRLLADAVARLASTSDWRAMLDVARRLPQYSPANCLLLAVQGAQGMVMGYHAWRQVPALDGGRCQVRRGARGLSILAPATTTVREPDDAGGAREVRRLVGFRRTTVFDERALVAPPDLPDVAPAPLQGQAPDRLWDATAAQVTTAGYRLITDGPAAEAIAPAYGRTDFAARTVTVRPDLSPAQQVKTLVHELAHTRLHDPANQADLPANRAAAEVEAESVAYLVLGEYGLDAADYTLPYLAAWSGGGTGVVLATARRTVEAARGIIAGLDRSLGTSALASPAQPELDADIEPVPTERPVVWSSPPAPVPIAGPGDAALGMTLDSLPNAATPYARIGTPAGRWELRWDPSLASFTADYTTTADHTATGDVPAADAAPPIRLGTVPAAIAHLGRLEERLGFALPAPVRAALAADQADRPAWSDRPWRFPDTDEGSPPPQTRPVPGSPVDCTGLAETTYWQAMRADPPLRTWSHQTYRLDILTAERTVDGDTGEVREQISYRLSHGDTVIFAGDDVSAPGHTDPRGDDTVRAVVDLLCYPEPGTAMSPVQRAFLDDHGDELLAGIVDPEPPYPAGTRVTVAGRAAGSIGRTGTVVDHTSGPGGDLLAYSWRPDRADLPGHPWRRRPGHVLVSPPGQVQPTLAAPDVGLTGWTPAAPLTYGSAVAYLDSQGQPATGHVLRAFPAPDGPSHSHAAPHSYDIRPDAPDAEPVRVPADRVQPTAGTAFSSLDALAAARDADGVALHPGELVAVGDDRDRLIDAPGGPTLLTGSPQAPTDVGL